MLHTDHWSPAEMVVLKFANSHDLMEELQEREEDLRKINGNFISGFMYELFLPLFQHNLDDPNSRCEWFLTFSGEIDGFLICLLLLPLACVYITQLLLNSRSPVYQEKGFDEQYHNVPTVPLIFLQQTILEKVLRRPRRNTIEWYASKFVVRVSDNLLYLNDLTVPIVPPEEVRNPWKSVHILNKFNALYRQSVQAVVARKESEHHKGYHKRRARKGSWRSLGTGRHDSRIVHPSQRSQREAGTSVTSLGGVGKTATVNLLDEAYATWKEQLQANPATDDALKTVDEYSVFNHQLMKRGTRRSHSRKSHPHSHAHSHAHHPHSSHNHTRKGSRTKTRRQIDLEDKQMDKELAFNPADISKMVHQVEKEEKLKKSRKQFSRMTHSRKSHHVGHRKSHHNLHGHGGGGGHHTAHPHHAKSATTIPHDMTPDPAEVNEDGTPKTVQFHEHANVRVLESTTVGHVDRKEPIRARTPEQITSLHKFLDSRLSKM